MTVHNVPRAGRRGLIDLPRTRTVRPASYSIRRFETCQGIMMRSTMSMTM